MRLRWWSRPEAEPEPDAPAEPEIAAAPEIAVAHEPAPPPAPEAELPAKLSLTLEEAKEAIRAAKGDVIQVGFLAGDYKRHQEEDPRSGETAAARKQLCQLIATRLRDRKLLAPDGAFELREDASA
jgi:hypothetical protein